MNRLQLKEYIEKIYILEKTKYEQKLLYNKLQHRMNELKKVPSPRFKGKESFFDIAQISLLMGGFCAIVIFFIIYFIYEFMGADPIMEFLWGDPPKYTEKELQEIMILKIVPTIVFALTVIFYGLSEAKKNARIDAENEKLKTQNTILKQNNERLYSIMKNNTEGIQSMFANTEQTLNTFYNKNIIFPKYRNLAAISSFYEYLQSGRCSALEGHEGAYNIFEEEIRMNTIITKLDDIIDRLDEISSNQTMLYNAINQSNNNSKRIYQSLQQTENNTALIAYNSKITAQNTEFLKWLNFLA